LCHTVIWYGSSVSSEQMSWMHSNGARMMCGGGAGGGGEGGGGEGGGLGGGLGGGGDGGGDGGGGDGGAATVAVDSVASSTWRDSRVRARSEQMCEGLVHGQWVRTRAHARPRCYPKYCLSSVCVLAMRVEDANARAADNDKTRASPNEVLGADATAFKGSCANVRKHMCQQTQDGYR